VKLPSKVTVHFGPPLDWSRYRRKQARDPAVLRTCYEEITALMQKTLDRLAREDPHPVLTRLRELDVGHAVRQLEGLFAAPPRPSRRAHARMNGLARL
jgi:hypothetical protein